MLPVGLVGFGDFMECLGGDIERRLTCSISLPSSNFASDVNYTFWLRAVLYNSRMSAKGRRFHLNSPLPQEIIILFYLVHQSRLTCVALVWFFPRPNSFTFNLWLVENYFFSSTNEKKIIKKCYRCRRVSVSRDRPVPCHCVPPVWMLRGPTHSWLSNQ